MVVVSPHLQAEMTRKRIDFTQTGLKGRLKTLDSVVSDRELADYDMRPDRTSRTELVKVASHARPRGAMLGVDTKVIHHSSIRESCGTWCRSMSPRSRATG
jgi:hypothetical protein